MDGGRAILHVDLDAFFASVEQLDNPTLAGKPVLVGHDGRRGVVAAASYEARVFGCHSALPMAVALRRCPGAVVLPPRGGRYRELSSRVFTILEQTTPLVEPLSIDEAFLDVTGSVALLGEPVQIARTIRGRIRDELGLTASVGVAPNKFLAKLASEWNKPDGLAVVLASELPDRLAALPLSQLWGVGPATEARLAGQGLVTFGDLQRLTLEQALARLGPGGEHLWRLARGEDDRPVVPDGQARSLSAEQTFGVDVADPLAVRQVLLGQAERVAERLRRHDLQGRTVTVKIRYGDFETISRGETLKAPIDRTDVVQRLASRLFDRWVAAAFQPVRLIGVGVSQLSSRDTARQQQLFADPQAARSSAIDRATDAIRSRFGPGAVHRGFPDTNRHPVGDDGLP